MFWRCLGLVLTDFTHFFKVASPALLVKAPWRIRVMYCIGTQAPIIYNKTKQIKAVCIFHGIYCSVNVWHNVRNTDHICIFESLWPSDTTWWHRSGSTLVQIMAWMVTDRNKPLPEPMLTYHQRGPETLAWGQFHTNCSRYLYSLWIWKLSIWYYSCISQGQWVTWLQHHNNVIAFHGFTLLWLQMFWGQ